MAVREFIIIIIDLLNWESAGQIGKAIDLTGNHMRPKALVRLLDEMVKEEILDTWNIGGHTYYCLHVEGNGQESGQAKIQVL
ncbi:MAG: hypothetical protein IJ374_06415 [Lachnospiraceae bacterium]|nr:hypothetical protein [Lachnospiraceae bacterium]